MIENLATILCHSNHSLKRVEVFLLLFLMTLVPSRLFAGEGLLQMSTVTVVDEQGRVQIALTLKNPKNHHLYSIHPMFHFHHSKSMMSMIPRLAPGESVTLSNTDHPAVIREGRYPLVAMARYRISPNEEPSTTQIHMDSFYFGEKGESVIEGRIETSVSGDQSLLQVFLNNTSASFKNVQMMLLLPPELVAENFKGIMGMNLRPGEKKYFEVPLTKLAGKPDRDYPVHLMLEYGEVLKHFSGEIPGKVVFGAAWQEGSAMGQLAGLAALGIFIFSAYRNRYRRMAGV